MGYSFYQIAWIFIIYAFLGWCSEVAYAAMNTGKFVNRGFNNGPICPIYGFGVLSVVGLLSPIKDNLILLFVVSVLFTTTIEFVAGWALEKIFHHKWWDYSKRPFNIKGYVCLKFSVIWGFACVFVMNIVQPMVETFINKVPYTLGMILLILLFTVLITDFTITLINVLKLPKKFRAIEEIEKAFDAASINLGENIAEKTLNIVEKKDELREKAMAIIPEYEERLKKLIDKMPDYEEMLIKYKDIFMENNIVQNRLFKAYPHLFEGKYKTIFDKIKKYSLKKK